MRDTCSLSLLPSALTLQLTFGLRRATPPAQQNSYSLLNRTNFETDLAEVCSPRHTNVGLLAYSPLAGGSLTGKYMDGTPEGARFTLFPGYMDRFNKSLAKDAVVEYVAVRTHH
jgi:aryl-alcohol dehydrogenase-like predicted oxidoreductase